MSELDNWKVDDYEQMLVIERAIIAALLPLVEQRNPLLGVFALIRCARVMLRQGDREAQRELLPIISAFLQGRTAPPGEQSLLWLPPTMRN